MYAKVSCSLLSSRKKLLSCCSNHINVLLIMGEICIFLSRSPFGSQVISDVLCSVRHCQTRRSIGFHPVCCCWLTRVSSFSAWTCLAVGVSPGFVSVRHSARSAPDLLMSPSPPSPPPALLRRPSNSAPHSSPLLCLGAAAQARVGPPSARRRRTATFHLNSKYGRIPPVADGGQKSIPDVQPFCRAGCRRAKFKLSLMEILFYLAAASPPAGQSEAGCSAEPAETRPFRWPPLPLAPAAPAQPPISILEYHWPLSIDARRAPPRRTAFYSGRVRFTAHRPNLHPKNDMCGSHGNRLLTRRRRSGGQTANQPAGRRSVDAASTATGQRRRRGAAAAVARCPSLPQLSGPVSSGGPGPTPGN